MSRWRFSPVAGALCGGRAPVPDAVFPFACVDDDSADGRTGARREFASEHPPGALTGTYRKGLPALVVRSGGSVGSKWFVATEAEELFP